GVKVEGPTPLAIFVDPHAGGRIDVELRGPGGRPHARCTVVVGAPAPLRPLVDCGAPAPRREDGAAIYANRRLFHGPRFHALEALEAIGPAGVAAILRTDPRDFFAAERALHTAPLALDGAFQAAVLWCRDALGAPSLPSRLGAWRFAAPLPARVRAVGAVRAVEGLTATLDFDLLDEGGVVVAQVEGYVCTASPGLEAAYGAAGSEAA